MLCNNNKLFSTVSLWQPQIDIIHQVRCFPGEVASFVCWFRHPLTSYMAVGQNPGTPGEWMFIP